MTEGHDALYDTIDQLLSTDALDEARSALETAPRDQTFQVLRIRLELLAGSMPPGLAMQKLIQMMRETPDLQGAKTVYQEASKLAYSGRESSVAHSHPPPPVAPKR